MGRTLLLFLTLTTFYTSMTCVHIPYIYRVNIMSTGLISNNLNNTPSSLSEVFKKMEPEQAPTNQEIKEEMPFSFEDIAKKNVHSDIKISRIQFPVPDYIRGIYISNGTALSYKKLSHFIEKSKLFNINTMVVDVQKKMVPKSHVEMLKNNGIYPVARVVVFLGGLKTKYPEKEYIDSILALMEAAAHQGFEEVQLDYIRYADDKELLKIPLKEKYHVINTILEAARATADRMNIRLSADVFGRITLNNHDHIGQKLENFSHYVDSLYPMLYPSHYTGDFNRISQPYNTIKEGVENSISRCGKVRIIAYIQGFNLKTEQSGKSLVDYIKDQMSAVEDANGAGWIIWNAKNDYESSYKAIAKADMGAEKEATGQEIINDVRD